jgi:EmrB/QacA subfamily drug resistance transporter
LTDAKDFTADENARIKRLLPWLVAVAFFMESLDATILNTAVPVVAKALNVSSLSMKSVLSAYTLSLAVFIPISSWVADRFGTRRVFFTAIAIFTLGSFLCGISNHINLLVAFRILQGCGGAMMVPVGRLTLVRSFARSELVRAMTLVAIPALIGPMLGPLAGGLIVGLFHWRMIFFVNIPIGLAGMYLVRRYLPDYKEPVGKIDIVGLILFGAGIALLSYILEIFSAHNLLPGEVFGLFGLAMILLLGYGVHARGIKNPLLRLDMFKIRTLRACVLGNFITRLGVGGLPFLLPLLYQIGLGFTPIQSGLMMMPQSIAALGLRAFIGSILTYFGYRAVLLTNTIALGISIAAFGLVGEHTPLALIIIQSCLFGFFSSTQYTCMNTLVYADVPNNQTSMASTIVSTVQQLALSFGVAGASIVTAFFIPDAFRPSGHEMVHGLHKAFLLLGGLTVLSAFVFAGLKNNDGDNMSLHKSQPV